MSEFVLAKPGKKYTGVQPRGMKTLIFEDGKRLSCHWQDFNELFIPLSVREQQIRYIMEEFRGDIYDADNKIDKFEGRRLEELAYRKCVAAILGIESGE